MTCDALQSTTRILCFMDFPLFLMNLMSVYFIMPLRSCLVHSYYQDKDVRSLVVSNIKLNRLLVRKQTCLNLQTYHRSSSYLKFELKMIYVLVSTNSILYRLLTFHHI